MKPKPTEQNDSTPELYLELLLDEQGRQRTLHRTLFAIVALFLVFIAWALLVQIDELARSQGEIQPGGHVRILQTEEGGSVVALHVKDGDAVKSGQLIADFAATDLGKLRRQTEIRIASLAIDRERMQAVLEQRQPDLEKFKTDYPLLVEQAMVTFRTELASRAAALSGKRSVGEQQKALLGGSEADKIQIAEEIRHANEKVRQLEIGARKGVITQLALSDARQQLANLKGRQAEMAARSLAGRNSVSEAQSATIQLRAELDRQLSLDLSKVTTEYRELLAEQKALDERQGRSAIVAPVDGTVMNLPQTGAGAVLTPGGVVAEIVPSNAELVMDVMVSPRDIGFIKAGQKAKVRIDSFDSARFGSIAGEVRRVAPTSSRQKDGGAPFYRVEIALAQHYVGTPEHRLIPGMTGEADIVTGRKSVMQYLLKPIFLTSNTAFHER